MSGGYRGGVARRGMAQRLFRANRPTRTAQNPSVSAFPEETPVAGGLQAVRFDAIADRLTMPSAALPAASGAWTVGGWIRIEVDRNDETVFWSLDANFSSGWHGLHTTADGVGLRVNSSGSEVVTGPDLTVGVWYFVVVRKTAADALKMYVGTEAGGALSTYTGTAGAITSYAGDGYVGSNAYDQFLNGRMWGLRLWDAELSDAEVDAEYSASSAARTSNLRAQWLLDNATTPGTDSSGNGRTLTNTGGAWALEAGPTLPTGSGATVSPAAVGVLTGVNAPSLAATVTVGTAGVLTGVQTPSTAAGITIGTAGVLTGVQTPGTAAGIAVGTAGVVTGVNAVATAAGIAMTPTGVLTGVQTPSTAAGVPVGTVGVLTGLNAPSVSTSGNVSPSPVGVLTGVQTPSLAAGVAPGAVGALTGVQTASLAASVAVGAAGVLTGVNATATSTVVLPAAVGVLTGVQSVSVEPPLPDVWAMVGASRTRAVVTSSGASRVTTSSGSSGAVSATGSSSATTTGDAGGSSAKTT